MARSARQFGNVENGSTIAHEEIFGPVLSVIPADDVERARTVAGALRSGTVGHNAFRTGFGIAFGGFKQAGIGRDGGLGQLGDDEPQRPVVARQVAQISVLGVPGTGLEVLAEPWLLGSTHD